MLSRKDLYRLLVAQRKTPSKIIKTESPENTISGLGQSRHPTLELTRDSDINACRLRESRCKHKVSLRKVGDRVRVQIVILIYLRDNTGSIYT